MANRGNLNWSGSNTTYSVSAGYYTGGTLDSRTSYSNGYSSGRTQGQTDVKNSPNSYGLYTKTQYDNNYNSGRTQGQNDVKNSPNSYGLYSKSQYDANYNNGMPSMISGMAWVRDSCDTSSWTCSTAGMYFIYVYGYVGVTSRYVKPSVSFSGGTQKASGTIANATADVRQAWIYQFSSGHKVTCSWSQNHGSYSWRNGFLVIRIK